MHSFVAEGPRGQHRAKATESVDSQTCSWFSWRDVVGVSKKLYVVSSLKNHKIDNKNKTNPEALHSDDFLFQSREHDIILGFISQLFIPSFLF